MNYKEFVHILSALLFLLPVELYATGTQETKEGFLCSNDVVTEKIGNLLQYFQSVQQERVYLGNFAKYQNG